MTTALQVHLKSSSNAGLLLEMETQPEKKLQVHGPDQFWNIILNNSANLAKVSSPHPKPMSLNLFDSVHSKQNNINTEDQNQDLNFCERCSLWRPTRHLPAGKKCSLDRRCCSREMASPKPYGQAPNRAGTWQF